ncbi:hypothetical protein E2C01_023072 [Portunus trituberculatus]|uniref:Uncharacterized protein n=1 Tax=Portunus trituberculatus TaxID=210409 RepID=A0A5B7E729_PORTR|nr:hypothetical protein [Portunus trituberculatus]
MQTVKITEILIQFLEITKITVIQVIKEKEDLVQDRVDKTNLWDERKEKSKQIQDSTQELHQEVEEVIKLG